MNFVRCFLQLVEDVIKLIVDVNGHIVAAGVKIVKLDLC